MVPQARHDETEHGLAAATEGWFVLGARDATWYDRGPRGLVCDFEEGQQWEQLGVNLFVLRPGNPMSMYHWEADQEDFLVVHGEALLVVEGEERALRQWDFIHCPPGVKHVIVGAGDGPCVVVAVGARQHQDGEGWGGYTVDEAAARHDAAAPEETSDPKVAYGRFPPREPARYEEGWLP
jgi:quercetin dioxygenase-like cupin family protein